jgi:hypothetical protein
MMQPVRNVNGTVSATLRSAFGRAVLLGLLLALAAFVKDRPDTSTEAVDATYDALGILFGVLIARGGLEGAYDARRQSEGSVNASDVQTNPPAVVVAPPGSPAHDGN